MNTTRFTVLLLRPDYICDNYDVAAHYTWQGPARSPDDAVYVAQHAALSDDHPDGDADEYGAVYEDYLAVAVYAGDVDNLLNQGELT